MTITIVMSMLWMADIPNIHWYFILLGGMADLCDHGLTRFFGIKGEWR